MSVIGSPNSDNTIPTSTNLEWTGWPLDGLTNQCTSAFDSIINLNSTQNFSETTIITWEIYIEKQELTSCGSYVQITDDSWNIFVCDPSDISNGILNQSDILVVNTSGALRSFSIVTDSHDTDATISVTDSTISGDIFRDCNGKYARSVVDKTGKYFTVASFDICRLKDAREVPSISYWVSPG